MKRLLVVTILVVGLVAVAGSISANRHSAVADGNPPPPFPWYVADGNPPPPFPWLTADGNPPPPFPKPPLTKACTTGSVTA